MEVVLLGVGWRMPCAMPSGSRRVETFSSSKKEDRREEESLSAQICIRRAALDQLRWRQALRRSS